MSIEGALMNMLETVIRRVIREELGRREDTGMPEDYLSIKAAAETASVSQSTLRRWIRDGKLEVLRQGNVLRVRRSELDRCLQPERYEDVVDFDKMAREILRRG